VVRTFLEHASFQHESRVALADRGSRKNKLEGVAPLDKRDPLRDQALEFDQADFQTISLDSRAALRDLIVVEIAGDAIGI